jgi:hypothetical protein
VMTNDQFDDEGAEEAIEDLEAPADAQTDVAGGKGPACGSPSMVCAAPTCKTSAALCRNAPVTSDIVVYET